MSDTIGGFWTTGIWVMLRKFVVPAVILGGIALVASPSYRTEVTGFAQALMGSSADLSHVPGLDAGVASAGLDAAAGPRSGPPEGGYLFHYLGIGKPVVSEDTPRVHLNDLPASSSPVVVKLRDLPQPSSTIVYRLDTRSNRRAPVVRRSPRPLAMPAHGGTVSVIDPGLGIGDRAAMFLSRLGLPTTP